MKNGDPALSDDTSVPLTEDQAKFKNLLTLGTDAIEAELSKAEDFIQGLLSPETKQAFAFYSISPETRKSVPPALLVVITIGFLKYLYGERPLAHRHLHSSLDPLAGMEYLISLIFNGSQVTHWRSALDLAADGILCSMRVEKAYDSLDHLLDGAYIAKTLQTRISILASQLGCDPSTLEQEIRQGSAPTAHRLHYWKTDPVTDRDILYAIRPSNRRAATRRNLAVNMPPPEALSSDNDERFRVFRRSVDEMKNWIRQGCPSEGPAPPPSCASVSTSTAQASTSQQAGAPPVHPALLRGHYPPQFFRNSLLNVISAEDLSYLINNQEEILHGAVMDGGVAMRIQSRLSSLLETADSDSDSEDE